MMPESAALATAPRLIKGSRRDQAVRDGRCMFFEAGVKQLKSKLQKAAVVMMQMSGAAENGNDWKRITEETW